MKINRSVHNLIFIVITGKLTSCKPLDVFSFHFRKSIKLLLQFLELFHLCADWSAMTAPPIPQRPAPNLLAEMVPDALCQAVGWRTITGTVRNIHLDMGDDS